MIVIRKKQILIAFTIIIVTIFAFSFKIAELLEETTQTVALPVSKKTIVIDAGHGVPDEGAESSNRNN